METIIILGSSDVADKIGSEFHNAAKTGNKRKLRKCLEKGIQVDYPNGAGQSPLFCACYFNEETTVKELLRYGANPNERSNTGITPVHVAALNGNLKVMNELLAAGGDLRLHDHTGRTSKEFALLQPDQKKRLKMLEFIEKTRLFALTKSGRDLRATINYPRENQRISPRSTSLMKLIRNKLRGDSTINLEHQMKSCQSMGYGKVYVDGNSFSGIICTLPLVSENMLRHDTQGFSFNNGSFMVMESMLWQNTRVTAKRLHREAAPGGEVDLLITEAEYIGKLRHPNIMVLMGVCQTNNLESMVLLFERVENGSLYETLHQKQERLSSGQIQDITIQISDALVFLHEQNVIHCYITSHAVMMMDSHLVKLANFEYVVDRVDGSCKSFVNQNMYQNVAYNWMAPEIMWGSKPVTASDVYSLTVVIWEMFHGVVPWGRFDTESVRQKVLQDKEQLQVEIEKIPDVFKIILQYGLQLDPLHRKLQMFNIRNLLTIPAKNVEQYMEKLLKQEKEAKQAIVKSSKGESKPARPPKPKRYEGESSRDQSGSKPASPSSPDRSDRKSPGPQRRIVYEDQDRDRRYDNNQSSRVQAIPDYTQDDKLRFVDQMKFNHKDIDWELKEEQQGSDYYYTVLVSNDKKHLVPPSEPSESEVGSSVSEQGNKSLMSKFSYLKVQQQGLSPPGKSIVKPASHCTEARADLPLERKLSTAGSVYALYNMDYHTPAKTEHYSRTPLYNTMPRKKQRLSLESPRDVELRPASKDWFGGAGSVKNLVEMYQKQENEHSFQQNLLHGKLSTADIGQHHQIKSIYPNIQHFAANKESNDVNNQSLKSPGVKQSADCDITTSSSLTTVSPEESKGKKGDSSPSSEMVSDWVDTELVKIKSTLSEEVFGALGGTNANDVIMSPLLFEDNCSSTPAVRRKKTKPKKVQNKKKAQYDVEEFYIDDEINPDTHKLSQKRDPKHRHHPDYIKPLRDQCKSKNSSLREKSYHQKSNSMDSRRVTYNDSNYQKKLREYFYNYDNSKMSSYGRSQHYDSDISSDSVKVERNKQLSKLHTSFHAIPQQYGQDGTFPRMDDDTYPKIVSALGETDQQKLRNKVEEKAAFASTVIVETNRMYPDHHRVTHTLTDLADGTTSALYGKNVKASRLMSALVAQ